MRRTLQLDILPLSEIPKPFLKDYLVAILIVENVQQTINLLIEFGAQAKNLIIITDWNFIAMMKRNSSRRMKF